MVQWPELCGRGAISLTSTRPSGSTNISTASKPTRSSASATAAAMRLRRRGDRGGQPRRGEA